MKPRDPFDEYILALQRDICNSLEMLTAAEASGQKRMNYFRNLLGSFGARISGLWNRLPEEVKIEIGDHDTIKYRRRGEKKDKKAA